MALHHNMNMERQTKELCDRHGANMMRLNTVHSREPILQLTEGRRDAYRKMLRMGIPAAEVHPCECRWRHCGESFIRQEALVSHVNMAHVNVERNVEYRCHWAECPRRGKGFNARYKMMIHIRTHTNEKPHPCGICSKRFLRLENLKIHIRSHTGEKPYICPFEGCKKAYSNSSDRFKHVRTHFTEKPYACKMPGCNKCYTDPSSLRKHVKTNGHNVSQLHHDVSLGLPAFQHSIKELPSTFYITNGGARSIMSQSSSLSGSCCSLPEQVISLQGSMVHLSALMSNPLLSSAIIAPLVSTQTTSTQTDSEVPPEVTSMYKTLLADTDSLSDVSNDSQQDLPLDLTMSSNSSSELQSDAQSQSSDDAHYSSTSQFLESGHYSPIWRSFTP